MDYIDGFLEGHESTTVRVIYRLGMASYILLTLFASIANLAVVRPSGHIYTALNSVSLLGFLGLTLKNAHWYRKDNLDPKFRRATVFLMFCVIVLDVAGCMAFHDALHPEPKYYPPAETPVPTFTPPFTPEPPGTPAPPNATGPNMTFFERLEADEEYRERREKLMRMKLRGRRR
jgi:hypothetical protein